MNDLPLISILIPVYNTQKYVKSCLLSILNQTYKNIEVIVVDDGSTDDSLKVINEVAATDSRIKVFHKENEKNIAKVRNFSLSKMSGQYFTFIDSDDYINKNHILNLYTSMIEYDSDISVCGIFINFIRAKRFSLGIRKGVIRDKSELISKYFLTTKFSVSMCNKLFRYDIGKDLRFDESIKTGEDVLFCFNYLKRCNSLSYTKKRSYNYYMRPGSEIHQKFSSKHVSYVFGLEKLIEEEKNKLFSDILKGVTCISCAFLLFKMKRANFKEKDLIDKCNKYAKEYKNELLGNKYTCLLYRFGWHLFKLICIR